MQPDTTTQCLQETRGYLTVENLASASILTEEGVLQGRADAGGGGGGVTWTSLHVNYEVPTLSPVHSQRRDNSVRVIFFFKVLTKVTLTFPSLSLNFRQVSS